MLKGISHKAGNRVPCKAMGFGQGLDGSQRALLHCSAVAEMKLTLASDAEALFARLQGDLWGQP